MEKKQTALMELYDKILPYTTNGKELLAVDVLTLIQEKYLPKEREQIEAMRIYAKEQNAELEEVLKGFVNSFYRSDLKFGSQLMVYDKALALIKKTTNE